MSLMPSDAVSNVSAVVTVSDVDSSCAPTLPSPAPSPFVSNTRNTTWEDASDCERDQGSPWEGRQSGIRTFVSMFKYVVGTGLLGHALAMHDLGIVGYFIVGAFFCTMSIWGNYLLGYTLDVAGRADLNMAELGDRACGRPGFVLAIFLCFCDNWGGIIAYLKALASTIQPVLQDERVLGDSFLTQEWVLILAFTVLVYPLALYRKMESLGWVLIMGSIGISAFVATVVGYACWHAQSLSNAPLLHTDIDGAIALPVIAFSFDCQCNIFPNYRELDAPVGAKASRLGGWAALALVASFLCSALVALCGYASFRDDLDDGGNLLSNFSNSYAALKILVFVSVIPDVPLNCFEATRILQDHAFGHSRLSNVLISAALMGSGCLVAILLPSVYAAFGYVGAIASMTLTTVMPPLFLFGIVRRSGDEDFAPLLLAAREKGAQPLRPRPSRMFLALCAFTLSIGLCVVPCGVVLTYLGS